MERMNRAQFHAALAPLSQDQLRKVLWTLYWRGPAAVRERIEAELIPNAPSPRPARADPAPDQVLAEIHQFAALARDGSYLAADRRVKPSDRTRWRFTFKRLVTRARDALRVDATGDGATGMEILSTWPARCVTTTTSAPKIQWKPPGWWSPTRWHCCGPGSATGWTRSRSPCGRRGS